MGGVDTCRAWSQAEQNVLVPEHPVTSTFLIEKLSWITKLDFSAELRDAEPSFFLEMEGSFASTSLRLHGNFQPLYPREHCEHSHDQQFF